VFPVRKPFVVVLVMVNRDSLTYLASRELAANWR
jgi:hypothetical protein